MLNPYKISDGFCLDTFYAILMYRDISFSKKMMGFLKFNIHRLREIYCLFKLKSLLELNGIPFWTFSQWYFFKFMITPLFRNRSSITTVNREKFQIMKKSMLAVRSSSHITKLETTGDSKERWERI